MNNTILSQKFYFRYLFCICLGLFSAALNAQTGVVLDTPADDTIPQFPRYNGGKGSSNTKKEISLKSYCPSVYDQKNTNSCVAFAFCYGGFSIFKNVENKRNKYRYSAAFMFNLAKRENGGIKPSAAVDFMKNQGFCFESDFPNSNVFIKKDPPKTLQNQAKTNAITVGEIAKETDRIQEIKGYLCDSQPVVVIVKIESNFRAKHQNNSANTWVPNVKKTDPPHHAMVIIGYSDNGSKTTFELMNSDGPNWGEQGFIKIEETDLKRVIVKAYAFRALDRGKGEGTTDSLAAPIDSTQTTGIGTFELKRFENTDNPDPFHAQNILINEESTESAYETTERFALNSQFRLHAAGIPTDKKLYVFSLDAVGAVTIHQQPDTSLEQKNQPMPTDKLWVIPSKDKTVIGVKYKGKDQIIILISDSILTNFQQQLDVFTTKKGTAQARLEAVFGDALMPKTGIEYMKSDDTKMYVKSRVWHAAKQQIVPIILDIRMTN